MSSNEVVIDVRNVSKWFDVEGSGVALGPSEVSDVSQKGASKYQALDDVSFQVCKGETVGIVGRNGAGKSTLLRIISGIMKPDKGKVKIAGRAYSVMGMGIGLRPNLTGAENIMIKSAVMGLSKAEIDERYDSIVDFAELGDYIKQPMRTYSKGMRARLAFAITFAFDPEILIVDEALSGGDGAFKRKAEARLNEINESGATILLVSHGGGNHKRLCNRSILLDRGHLLNDGPPKQILQYYKRILGTPPGELPQIIEEIRNADPDAEAAMEDSDRLAARAGTGSAPVLKFEPGLKSYSANPSKPRGAEILTAGFKDAEGGPINVLPAGPKAYAFDVTARFDKTATNVYAELCIKNEEGVELCWYRSHQAGRSRPKVKAGTEIKQEYQIRNRLLDGDYFIDVTIHGDAGEGPVVLHRITDMVTFQSTGTTDTRLSGIIDLS
tara:strand:- start:4377 stop:5696 length:1320 start_codon:yes stop_codon:yes gene_type:complete